MNTSSRSHTAQKKRIRDRDDAIARLKEFIDWTSERPAPRYVFRGQSSDWPLTSSVGRNETAYSADREVQLFNEFKRNARGYLHSSLDPRSDWEWLALAQHHGLPTRLLDWTTNALVAAFFSCAPSDQSENGRVSCVAPKDLGLIDLDDNPEGPFSIKGTKFIYTPIIAPRIAAQRGLFSVHSRPTLPLKLADEDDQFTFEDRIKKEVRRLLHRLGIDDHFLMGGLDGLSTTLKWRFESRMILA